MNPYEAYKEDTILSSDPIGLIVAMYESAIDSCAIARTCLANKDIPGRTKAVNKICAIIGELMRALDDEKGGEISQNLRRLYVYIQGRVTEAHFRQTAAPLIEAEKLFATMLEGWKGAKTGHYTAAAASSTVLSARSQDGIESDFGASYGYLPDMSEMAASSAYSF